LPGRLGRLLRGEVGKASVVQLGLSAGRALCELTTFEAVAIALMPGPFKLSWGVYIERMGLQSSESCQDDKVGGRSFRLMRNPVEREAEKPFSLEQDERRWSLKTGKISAKTWVW